MRIRDSGAEMRTAIVSEIVTIGYFFPCPK